MLKLFSKSTNAERRMCMPRDEIACSATLRAGNAFHRVHLSDVTRKGCKVVVDAPLKAGEAVQIALEAFHSLGGTIRWYQKGLAGIEFSRPLSDAAVLGWKQAMAKARTEQQQQLQAAKQRRNFLGEQLGPDRLI